jgi:hypothetical protein
MAKQKDIIKVHLHYPYQGKTDFYYSNLTNLYSYFSSHILGICRQSLINAKLYDKRFYANAFCTIEIVTLD